MAVRHGFKNLLTQPFPEFHNPLLMTGRTEVATFTRKCKQVLVTAIAAPDPRKTVMEDTAIQITVNYVTNIGPEKPVLSRKLFIIFILFSNRLHDYQGVLDIGSKLF